MKNITILQIVCDVILIALSGYLGFTAKSPIDLFVAFLWCICLCLHIYWLKRFKA